MSDFTTTAIVPASTQELSLSVDSFQQGLTRYLDVLGLPSSNVLVDITERGRVLLNLPDVVNSLSPDSRLRSHYVSKFVAAVGAGLFDAALNFVWDETVSSLREKVVQFDLEHFYNSVITDPDRRKKYSSQDDLVNLDDWELIRGCHLTGVLSDLGFRHLDYIRNMRNWASAAHPNQNQLSGLQLVSWLETCIREVIGKAPSAPAIEVKRLLQNIRTHTLGVADVETIRECVVMLPLDLATSLLRTIFGMFCDPSIDVGVKNNIRLIAVAVWGRSPDDTWREIGVKYATYAANADIPRRDAAKDFLQVVDGLAFLPKDTLAVEMSDSINCLFLAHTSFNNFHNEPAHAKLLARYVPANGVIPDSVRSPYVKTVTMCFIGNGYGVSNGGVQYYSEMTGKFQSPEIYALLCLMEDEDFSSRLQFPMCLRRFRELLNLLVSRTSTQVLLGALNYLLSRTDQQMPSCGKATEFKRLLGR